MHNFDDLQKRCKRYRIKQLLKYILIFFLFLSVSLYFFLIMETKPPLKAKAVVKNSLKKRPIQEVKKTIKIETKTLQKRDPSITTKKTKKVDVDLKKYSLQFLVASTNHIKRINKKKRVLESLGFKECQLIQSVIYIHLVCNEANSLEALASSIELAKRNNIEYTIRTQNYKTRYQEIVTPKKDKKTPKIEQNSSLILKVQNTNTKQLQKNFLQAPSYNVAITIAHSYYKKRDLKNAIIWAKKANQIDKDDAESWILYAKSLYALHQENKAQQLLHIYLQYESSAEVDNLLKGWEKNQ